jgi:hypothetical protein
VLWLRCGNNKGVVISGSNAFSRLRQSSSLAPGVRGRNASKS